MRCLACPQWVTSGRQVGPKKSNKKRIAITSHTPLYSLDDIACTLTYISFLCVDLDCFVKLKLLCGCWLFLLFLLLLLLLLPLLLGWRCRPVNFLWSWRVFSALITAYVTLYNCPEHIYRLLVLCSWYDFVSCLSNTLLILILTNEFLTRCDTQWLASFEIFFNYCAASCFSKIL